QNSECQLGPGKNRRRREFITGLYRLHFSRAEPDSRNRRPLAPAVQSGGRSSCDAGTASPARTGSRELAPPQRARNIAVMPESGKGGGLLCCVGLLFFW